MKYAFSVLPFQNPVLLKAVSSREKIIVKTLQLIRMTTVMHPDMRHTRDPTGKAQEIFSGSAVLVSNQQTFCSCFTLCERLKHM